MLLSNSILAYSPNLISRAPAKRLPQKCKLATGLLRLRLLQYYRYRTRDSNGFVEHHPRSLEASDCIVLASMQVRFFLGVQDPALLGRQE